MGNTFLNSTTLLQMDRLLLSAVYCITDGVCKDNTSNDMFSRCKSVQNMATGKNDDQFIQPDNKLIIGTKSGNSELTMIAW